MIIIDPSNNLTLDDLTTIDKCDDAEALLDNAILTIELQLADPERVAQEPDWAFSANHALRAKRIALRAVQRKRGSLRRQFASDWKETFVDKVRREHNPVYVKVTQEIHNAS